MIFRALPVHNQYPNLSTRSTTRVVLIVNAIDLSCYCSKIASGLPAYCRSKSRKATAKSAVGGTKHGSRQSRRSRVLFDEFVERLPQAVINYGQSCLSQDRLSGLLMSLISILLKSPSVDSDGTKSDRPLDLFCFILVWLAYSRPLLGCFEFDRLQTVHGIPMGWKLGYRNPCELW